MNAENLNYLEESSKMQITEVVKKKIEKHQRRYSVSRICAYYIDWEDFCSDWCDDIGYTRTEARKLLHGGRGEFQIIENFGIVRYVI